MATILPCLGSNSTGRKTKVLKAQLAAETAAAQTAAQKQAMIETAAAFRGVHLDANARHWDEVFEDLHSTNATFLTRCITDGGRRY